MRWIFAILLLTPCLALAAEKPSAGTTPPRSGAAKAPDIPHLIAALGDKDYYVRQKAEQDLARIGFAAVDALGEATESDDLEIASRAGRLLRIIKSNWVQPDDPPGVAQQLSDYESQDDATRDARIAALVTVSNHEGASAVCRIICYERSPVLAKLAAVRLMQSFSADAAKSDTAAEVGRRLEGCRRVAARWVHDWLAARSDAQALAAMWTKIVDEEQSLLVRRPRDTSPAIVETLLQLQIAALREAHRGTDAAASVGQLLKLHHGDPTELAKLLDWLMKEKDWEGTRVIETKYRKDIAASAALMYLLAEAQARRGDGALAEKTADEALKLNSEVDLRSLETHFQMGRALEDRGRHDWAIHEWDHVSRAAPAGSVWNVFAAHFLAELYHDLERDQDAADTLARLESGFAGRSDEWKMFGEEGTGSLTLGEMRARKHFFEACHWRDKGDRAKERAALDAALTHHGYDIEVLIECWRLPGADADYRVKTRKLIEKKLNELREQIGDSGDNSSAAQPCNEFAWLVANTEGDLDEALRLSKRSLELTSSDNGSYRDTLARVYFAKGDFDQALKEQTAAAAVLPFNRPVSKQLEVLREKVKQKGEKK